MSALLGRCFVCGKDITRRGATRHIKSCLLRNMKDKPKHLLYQIFISSLDFLDYWMIIEMRGDATLEDLDWFLRDIWVECCDHLSSFTIGDVEYYQERILDVVLSTPLGLLREVRSARIPIRDVLKVGAKFYYKYDFGTPTRLELKVISTRKGELKKKIRLLARNYPPKLICNDCGSEAKYIVVKYENDEEVWEFYCEKCIGKHEDEAESIYPVVNSPRIGLCGYDGEESPLVKVFKLHEY